MKSKASKFKFVIADKTQQSSNHNIVIHLKKSAVVGWDECWQYVTDKATVSENFMKF